MTCTAHDCGPSPVGSLVNMDMTVLGLAALLCVDRAREPLCIEGVGAVLAGWFACAVCALCPSAPVAKIVLPRWLIRAAGRLKASNAGRKIARPLLGGIMRRLDQGKHRVDVALMMSVLRLARGERDGGFDR